MEEAEPQVCRLCGQAESMYIDVFSEEGTKRLLGLKIHSKINILIDEKDLLPKVICVQCLGKLEFVCDFQEECLRTQELLRDQYNLPPLSDIVENKPEDSAPSTSTSNENSSVNKKDVSNESCIDNNININNNNNNCDKNLNSPTNEILQEDTRSAKITRKSQRSLRSQHKLQGVANNDENLSENIQQPEITTTTRRLRSRQSTELSETDTNSKNAKRASTIRKRLTSHNNNVDSTTNSKQSSNGTQQTSAKKVQVDNTNKIQIATNTLNKVLSAISNAPGVGVSVKESANRSLDAEDISFTVELSKKQETDSLTVLAKVFPDQGSCLVDKSIVTFLEDKTNEEVNNLVNNIVSFNESSDANSTLIDKLQNAEDIANSSRNPEELFKMDGEEIHVDDNVEQVNANNQVSYACKLCRKIYERKDKCTVHVKTHLGIKQYMCILCQAKFVCKSDVMKHIRCSHTNPRPISCPKCPKRFRSKFDLAEHMNVHKGVKPYQCADCDQSYHHKVSLQMHVKSHMPPQNLACEYCEKIFPYRTRLLSHIGSVHMKDRRNFRCRFCYNLYSSLAVLNEHIKTRHTTTYTCETCSKTFKVASKFKAHVLQHSNPKPFVCNICKNRYASKAFLNEHLLKHQGVRKHICQKCGAAFAQASHLAAHRHVHGEKSHACPECGKMFNRRDNMKVHRRRHLIPSGKKTNTKQKTMNSSNESRASSTEKIKPDDELPKTICMRCLGTVEFLCEFHNKCHNTQKNLTSDIEEANKNDTPEDKSRNDPESDKENVLPQQSTKRKSAKVSEQTKQASTIQEADENVPCQEIENSDTSPVGKIDNSLVDALTNNEKLTDSLPLSLDATNSIESNVPDTEIDINKSSKIGDKLLTNRAENQVSNTETKSRRSRGAKTDKNEKKINNKSKNSPVSSSKNKKSDSKVSNKTIDKYFSTQSEIKIKKKDRENMNPKHVDVVSVKNSGKDEQDNVIFEGTVINSMDGDTSIIMPITSDSLNDAKLVIDDAVMADGSEIVQAKEIIWVQENFQLTEPQKPKIVNANQPKTTSPAPGDEAETVGTNGIVVQTPEQDVSINTSPKQVIFVEVQLPTKENTVTLPKSAGCLKRKRSSSVSTTSSERRNSEGKFAKISELMTEEQKKDIETQYSIDMSKVDEIKVGQNIEFLDKCKYRCKICNIIYPRLDKCQVHIWRHLDMKPFFCNVCDFSTLTVSNIRCHIRKSHMKFKPFECHLCHKSYNSATLLEEHLNIHTGSRPYQCDFCDFASTSKQVLVHHVLIHKSKKDVLCDICGKAFFSKGRMRAHKISHNRERAFKCKLCSTYVLHEEALEKHMLNVHAKDYVCKICNKVYKSRKALHNHESVHSEAKFECPMCPNVYKSTHILKEHILKHQGIRQYKCKHCDKTFAQQSHLAAHSSVHSNVTYDCPGCGKGFNRHDNMKVHTKRCEKFLANPELKNLLTKRKISFSKNDTAKVAIRKSDATLDKTDGSNNTANQDSVIEDFELSGPVVEKEITSDKF